MVEQSLFRGAIEALNKLGLYDVVLPFLLIFTLMFAILEKTKILGTEEINGKEVPRKNLNSMIAFSVALFVVASTKAVSMINSLIANVIVFVVITFLYLLMIGTVFHPTDKKKEFTIPAGVKYPTMALGALVLIILFFKSLGVSFGGEVDKFFTEYVFTPDVLSAIVLMATLIISLIFIVKEPKSKTGGE
ncbi:MAG: hypothetical protein PWP03_847 [Candidatus Woesearchaeota archaeon]|nr:hypothetical protein [Candidatus Woesearchaeota archaeon]